MEEIKKIEVQGQQYGVADMLMRSVIGGNAQVIEWSHTHNMNDYKDAGTYRIKGERTGSPFYDNLPIMNSGNGHTIDGVLTVFDSSINRTEGEAKNDDCTVTQFLMLSNRVGGQEGDMYMRSAYGVTKDSLIWKPWEKYQTNMEVGVVTDGYTLNPQNLTQILSSLFGMNYLQDNGVYSGVYVGPKTMVGTTQENEIKIQDQTAIETFVMVVINNYAAAGDARCITQIKFAVTNGGVFSIEKRSTAPGNTYWSQWEPIGSVDQQLDGYSTNAVANKAVYAQFYEHQEEITKRATKDNLKQGLDWEANTNKEFHIKNRTHHMKDYLCKYFTGSPIAISKPSDTGYVVIAYDTDGDAKYLKVEIKANEYKTEEFLDAMGLPIIFTWDNGASTINVQSFSGTLEKLCMRAYYSSSATSFDDYFVKLDEGFLPSGVGGLPEVVNFNTTHDADEYHFGINDFTNLSIGSGVAMGREIKIGSSVIIGKKTEIGRNVKIDDNIHITKESLSGMTDAEWTNDESLGEIFRIDNPNDSVGWISIGRGARIGEGCYIGNNTNISGRIYAATFDDAKRVVSIGEGVNGEWELTQIYSPKDETLNIISRSFVSGGAYGIITLGNNTKIGKNVSISDGINITDREIVMPLSSCKFCFTGLSDELGINADASIAPYRTAGNYYRLLPDGKIGSSSYFIGVENRETGEGFRAGGNESWDNEDGSYVDNRYEMLLSKDNIRFRLYDDYEEIEKFTQLPYGLTIEPSEDGNKLLFSYNGKTAELPLTEPSTT